MTTSNGAGRGRLGPAQPGEGLGAHDPRALTGQAGLAEVGRDDRGGALVPLDEGRVRRAARQRLDPGRAAAGEQVEDARAAQVRLEDREQGLLDAVAERPGRVAGRLEPDPAGGAGDDPAGVRHRSPVAAASPARREPAIARAPR